MRKFDKIYQERMKMYGVVVEQNQQQQPQQQGQIQQQTSQGQPQQTAAQGQPQQQTQVQTTQTAQTAQGQPQQTAAQGQPQQQTQAQQTGGNIVNVDQGIKAIQKSNNQNVQIEMGNVVSALKGNYSPDDLEPEYRQVYDQCASALQQNRDDPNVKKIIDAFRHKNS